MKKSTALATGAFFGLLSSGNADQVFPDDVIIQNSLAVGVDSVNNENFGFDTIRLKENNLRIKFDDTSNSGSFPNNDWQLTANDSVNGGANKFSIDDISGGKTPFTIEASAPSNSLYVDDGGRIGLGTSSPVVEMHIVDGDSPTMRLEQNGSSGFTAQTWDVAGNETNFFVRDTTNGSKLPFKIKPNAPTNSLFVDSDGDIGLGTQSPAAKLEINGVSTQPVILAKSNGTPSIRMQNTIATTGSIWDTTITDTGAMVLKKSGETFSYKFGGDGSIDVSAPAGGFGGDTVIFRVDSMGNLTTGGTVNGTSDVGRKENFGALDPAEVLEKVATIPVKSWSYKGEDTVHVGPMAQDFYKAFRLGAGDRTISMADADGIALASIQALRAESRQKDKEITNLKTANEKLERRLNRIEALLNEKN